MDTKKIFKHIPWVILGIIGAFCLAVVALRRGGARQRPVDRGRLCVGVSGGLSLLQSVHRPKDDEDSTPRARRLRLLTTTV